MSVFDETMEKILLKPKYDLLTGRKISLSQKIASFVINIFEKILENIFELLNIDYKASDFNLNPTLLVNIFLIFIALLALVLIGIVTASIIRRKRKHTVVSDIFTEFRNNTMTIEELLNYAENYAKNGAYAEALRYHYIVLIKVISANNIVYITDSMTGGQFRRAVKKAVPEFGPGVDHTVELFNHLWFGKKNIQDEIYHSHNEIFLKLIGEAGRYEQKN